MSKFYIFLLLIIGLSGCSEGMRDSQDQRFQYQGPPTPTPTSAKLCFDHIVSACDVLDDKNFTESIEEAAALCAKLTAEEKVNVIGMVSSGGNLFNHLFKHKITKQSADLAVI